MPKFGSEFSGRLDPDGRFAVWRNKKTRNVKLKPAGETPYGKASEEEKLDHIEKNCGLEYNSDSGMPRTIENMLAFQCERQREREPEAQGSSKLINSATRRRRGSGGLTPHGKRLVRNGVSLLEFRVKREHLSLFTGTFPPMQPEDENAVVENFAKGINNFVKKLKRRCEKHGLCSMFVGAIEIQKIRSNETDEHGLHLHLVFQSRKPGKTWAITKEEIQELWQETWQTYLTVQYNWHAATRSERIVKSASAYLAKYMSKGSLNRLQLSNVMPEEIPLVSAWYVCSDLLRKWIEKNTYRGDACGELLYEKLRNDHSDVLFRDAIVREFRSGRVAIICVYGTIRHTNFAMPAVGSDIFQALIGG